MRYSVLFFLAFVLLTSSCRKGVFPENHTFGKVSVTVLQLPDVPPISIYFDTTRLGDVFPGAYPTMTGSFLAGQPGMLKIVNTDTKELLLDSSITITANTVLNFTVAFSEQMGLKGFIGNTNVSADSIRLQLLYNISRDILPDDELVDIHLYRGPTDQNVEELDVIKGIKRGELSPEVFTYAGYDDQGQPYIFFFKLFNSVTGEEIETLFGSIFATITDGTNNYFGKYNIVEATTFGDQSFWLPVGNVISF